PGWGAGVVEGLPECDALDRRLCVALDYVRWLDVQALVDRRDDVDGVAVLVAYLAAPLDSFGPGDDEGVGDAALIRGPALPHLVRRIERHRPAERVVVVGLLRA